MTRFALAIGLALAVATTATAEKDRIDLIRDYLDRCAAFGWSGSALVVVDGKVVLRKGYGFADPAAGRRNTPDTLFEIASTTKTFTACAILKLAEMGKLSLDDPIAKHLPGVPEDKRAITIAQLLAHTSGMPRNATAGRGPDLAKAAAAYLAPAMVAKPGEKHAYWNGGYALLAGIVERATGGTCMDFCREHIFKPAGMESSGFAGDAIPLERQAIGHAGGAPVRPAAGHAYAGSYGWHYRGMGGMVTSVEDLWRFVQAYDAGKILKPETIARMEAKVTPNYGLGWGLSATNRKSRRVGHGGDVRAFHTQFNRFPDERAVVIVVSNVDEVPMWTIAWNLEALMFDEPAVYPMPPVVATLKPKEIAAFAGAYVLDEKTGDGFTVQTGPGMTKIVLAAEGLRAGALLSGSPDRDLSGEVTKARAFLDAVIAGDEPKVRAALMSGIPTSWAQRVIDDLWPTHVKEWGKLRGIRTIGARDLGSGRVEVLLGLDHAKGMRSARIVLVGGRLSLFAREAAAHQVVRVLAPTSDTEFTTFAWQGRARPTTVVFERKGRRVVALVLRGANGTETRLVRER